MKFEDILLDRLKHDETRCPLCKKELAKSELFGLTTAIIKLSSKISNERMNRLRKESRR